MTIESKIRVTKHGEERFVERCKLKKRSVTRLSEIAYHKGLRPEDTKGQLRKWIENRKHSSPHKTELRLYGDKLWIYCVSETEVCFVTVLHVPKTLVNEAVKAKWEHVDPIKRLAMRKVDETALVY